MDIFALPDVFLRELMKTIKMKDRMRMRLTCRAFEQLVADSHAGYFESGRIFSYLVNGQKKNLTNIGNTSFGDIDTTEYRAARFINLRNRLFGGIYFENFTIKCYCDDFTLEFLRDLTDRFSIGALALDAVFNDETLNNTLQLLSGFPASKCTLNLYFIPDSERFLALPAMEELSVAARSEELQPIPADTFLKLISIHKNIYFKRVTMSADALMRAIQIISTNNVCKRTVQWYAHPPTVVVWLNTQGISEESEAGQSCGEFEIKRTVYDGGSMHLRYRNWMVLFDGFSWTGEGYSIVVSVTNGHDDLRV